MTDIDIPNSNAKDLKVMDKIKEKQISKGWFHIDDIVPKIGQKVTIKMPSGRPKSAYYKRIKPFGIPIEVFISKGALYHAIYWKPFEIFNDMRIKP